nr:hypothetical protein [Tanacetum cinerariifolium]
MADENVPALALTRSDDQILPFAAWGSFRNNAHQFMSPPSVDAIMDFVNELGYTEVIHFVPRMTLIICHLGRTHNIHQRSASPFRLAEEDLRLAKQGGKKKPTTAKQPKPKPTKEKSSKPAPVPKPKETKEEPAKPSPAKHSKMSGENLWTPITEEASTEPSTQPQDDTSANIVRESSSPVDAETGTDINKTNSKGYIKILQIDEEQGKDMDNQVNLKEKTDELDHGQDGSDPGKTPESRPQLEQEFIDEDQVRPDPEKLDNAYTIRDQFLNDKSTKDEPGKLNVDSELVLMVTVPIHQASASVPLLSKPIIDLYPPKPVSSTTQAPIFTATTTTTTTLLLPPPPP